MTDKMSNIIYAGYYTETKEKDWAHSPDLIQALKDNSDIFFGNTYIRQDSIADIVGLDEAIYLHEISKCPFVLRLVEASRELQRIKGLK